MARLPVSDSLTAIFFLIAFGLMATGWWQRDQFVKSQSEELERLQFENRRLRSDARADQNSVEVTCVCQNTDSDWEGEEHAAHAEECEPLSEAEIRAQCDILDFYGHMPGC